MLVEEAFAARLAAFAFDCARNVAQAFLADRARAIITDEVIAVDDLITGTDQYRQGLSLEDGMRPASVDHGLGITNAALEAFTLLIQKLSFILTLDHDTFSVESTSC